mmetsp:Transcript_60354/g.160688  ORF Transcript_60354/g.160688 Transcript_60354/m.160688 type:complete len:87 (-) Transcript_60354:1139-1399(-)
MCRFSASSQTFLPSFICPEKVMSFAICGHPRDMAIMTNSWLPPCMKSRGNYKFAVLESFIWEVTVVAAQSYLMIPAQLRLKPNVWF